MATDFLNDENFQFFDFFGEPRKGGLTGSELEYLLS
jgi:hypothetical protein